MLIRVPYRHGRLTVAHDPLLDRCSAEAFILPASASRRFYRYIPLSSLAGNEDLEPSVSLPTCESVFHRGRGLLDGTGPDWCGTPLLCLSRARLR